MAKISQTVLLLVTAICISSLGSLVHCHDKAVATAEDYDLMIIGRVYCDTCDTGFITPISDGVAGVNVTIVCKDREGGNVTYTVGGVTDDTGVYQIPVKGDHEQEVCDIEVQQSTRPDCDEFVLRGHSSRIRIPLDNGIVNLAAARYVKPFGIAAARYVKPFGFRKKEPLEECPEVLAKMGLNSLH